MVDAEALLGDDEPDPAGDGELASNYAPVAGSPRTPSPTLQPTNGPEYGPAYGPQLPDNAPLSPANAGPEPLRLGWWDHDDAGNNHDLNDRRGHSGLAGLKNQGATCYLNSLVQVLYMTPEFRRMIYSIPCAVEQSPMVPRKATSSPEPGDDAGLPALGGLADTDADSKVSPAAEANHVPPAEDRPSLKNDILFQMQVLFARMQYADVSSVSTHNLTTSFGWDNADVFVQHDVQELNRVLCDKLEEKMKAQASHDGATVGQLYKGVMLNMVKCMNCNRVSKREEDFYDVSLVIKGKKSIVDSLKEFCEVETMKDENAYHCERCASKQTAEKGIRFKSLPAVLNLQLKRFEYDWDNNQRVKLNDDISFPQWLEMDAFMVDPKLLADSPEPPEAADGLAAAPPAVAAQPLPSALDLSAGATSAALMIATASVRVLDEYEARRRHQRKGSSSRALDAIMTDKSPALDSKYELYGVLVHSGNAGFGHYYAYIKNFADGKWYKFNDEQVTAIDDDSIIRNGVWAGERERTSGSSYWSTASAYSQRSATPYMLVYRRRYPRVEVRPDAQADAPSELPQKPRIVYDEIKPIDTSEIPTTIVDYLDQEKKRKEAKKKERERELNSCSLEIFRSRVELPDITLKVDKTTTLQQVLEQAVAQAEADSPPAAKLYYRLRRVAARKNQTKRAMNAYRDSDYVKTMVQLGLDKGSSAFLYLEQDTDPSFPGVDADIDDDNVFFTVRLFDPELRRPTSVRDWVMARSTTLLELKQIVAPYVGLEPAQMVAVEEETDRQLNVMLVDDEPLSKYGIISGDIIHIEPLTPEHEREYAQVDTSRVPAKNAWSLVRTFFDERHNELSVDIEESAACHKRRLLLAAAAAKPESDQAAAAPPAAAAAAAGATAAVPRLKFQIQTNRTASFQSLKEALAEKVAVEPRRLRVFARDSQYGEGRLIKDSTATLSRVLSTRYVPGRICTDLAFDILEQAEDLRKGDKLINCRYHNANNEFVCAFEAKINKTHTLRQFKTELAAKTGVPEQLQVLSEWYNEHFYKLFSKLDDTITTVRIRRADVIRMDELKPGMPNISDVPPNMPQTYAFQLVEFKDWETQSYGRKEMVTSFPWLLTTTENATLFDLRLDIARRTGASMHNINIAFASSFPIVSESITPIAKYCSQHGHAALAAAGAAGANADADADADRELDALCKAENRDQRTFNFQYERVIPLSTCRFRALDIICWEDLRTTKKKDKENARASHASAAAKKLDASVLKIKN
eukprot:TRINITY_DN5104_c0_g1_i3.p1 TRINITY_DN5104_c0_g1~~TRINITY_DN5104_c0_g1_i3.p1  ORF type:complete len:1258 (-),score=480.84 TRINITY_DN5104_c0_g1_i3:52-3825(-)